MNTNNNNNTSQQGQPPLESFIGDNKENQYNMDQYLSDEIMPRSQPMLPLSASIEFRPRNVIANIATHTNVLTRQDTERRQQQQQQQEFQTSRQQQQRQQRQEEHQQRQQQQRERQRRRREKQQRRYEQWQESLNKPSRHEEYDEEYFKEMMARDPMDEPMDEMFNEILLEDYYYETMNPQERQQVWEQDHLAEFQNIPLPRPLGAPVDPLVQYVQQQDEQLWYDELDQALRVYDMQNEQYSHECYKNAVLLQDKEEWEQLAFQVQQLQ